MLFKVLLKVKNISEQLSTDITVQERFPSVMLQFWLPLQDRQITHTLC